MSKKSVLFEGGVEKISTLSDGSLRIHIGTPELSNETMVNLFNLNRKTGYVLLSPYPINQDQKDAVEKAAENIEHESTEFGNKTPSQRLRAVLYVYWEKTQPKQINPDTGNIELVEFDLFYKRELNKIVEHYKTKLD
jgi:hypothetical protein|tara:strand:+ start:11187 stop:11597 length:411 start_codon:yes stop_codon:yes gene_type:complete